MSTRMAVITVEVQIPSAEDCGEALSDVVSEIESGVQRTGLTYRVETNPKNTQGDGMLAMRTILAIVRAGTREFVTIDVCDTEAELAEAHAGIREGYTCEAFMLTDRNAAISDPEASIR